MGHTLLSLLGFLLLNLLYRGQAQDAVLTIEPNWTAFFTGESVTFKCDLTGGKGRGWLYSMYKDGQEFIPYGKYESFKLQPLYTRYSRQYQCLFQNGGSIKTSNTIYLYISDRNVILESPASTLFEGESVTLRCRHRTQREENAAFFRDGSLITTDRNHQSPLMAKNTVQVMSDGSSYSCRFGNEESEPRTLRTEPEIPLPVLSVSPSWPSPGASVTLNCRVDHPSAGWSFYWYKALPRLSDNSYRYELLAGSENETEQHLFIIDGQTHTAGYVCRAGTGDPVFYTSYSKPVFVWSGDLNSAASLTVSPDSVQHFTKTSVSLSCEGNSTEWRVMRFSEPRSLYSCSSWGTMTGSTCTFSRSWVSGVFWCESGTGQFSNAVNITKDDGEIILVSPVRPVAEGRPVTLSCKFKTGTVYNVDFYKDDKLIQNDTRSELTISAVSKSDEGFYKCKRRDSADGWTSPESWFSVKSASGHGKDSQFPVLLIVGLLGGVSLIILLLLFLCRYRKSKDSCYSRSQRTNQGPATDHMTNQDEIQNMPEYSTLLHGDRCLYETIGGPVEAGNGASNEPEESLYINVSEDQ